MFSGMLEKSAFIYLFIKGVMFCNNLGPQNRHRDCGKVKGFIEKSKMVVVGCGAGDPVEYCRGK